MEGSSTTEIVKKEEKTPIALQGGLLSPSTLDEALRVGNMLIKSGLVPKHFDTPEKIVVAMQYCSELGLPRLTGMRQIAIINGLPALFGDLPMALARRSGEVESYTEKYFNKEGKEISLDNSNMNEPIFGCIVTMSRKNGGSSTASFTLDDKEKAGLGKGERSCWTKYAKDMLMYRARGRVLKSLFPDYLNGVALQGYDYDIHPSEIGDKAIEHKYTKVSDEARDEVIKLGQETSQQETIVTETIPTKEIKVEGKIVDGVSVPFTDDEKAAILEEERKEALKQQGQSI